MRVAGARQGHCAARILRLESGFDGDLACDLRLRGAVRAERVDCRRLTPGRGIGRDDRDIMSQPTPFAKRRLPGGLVRAPTSTVVVGREEVS